MIEKIYEMDSNCSPESTGYVMNLNFSYLLRKPNKEITTT